MGEDRQFYDTNVWDAIRSIARGATFIAFVYIVARYG